MAAMGNIENILVYKGWIIAAIFVFLFIAERIYPAALAVHSSFHRVLKNLGFWPLNIALSAVVVIPVSYQAAQIQLWQRPESFSYSFDLLIDILLLDLFIYWWHKAMHEVPFLWRFHEVHHLDQHLDTTSALRFHFGEVFFSAFVRALVVIAFGVSFTSVIIFEIAVMACAFFHHSNLALPKALEKVLSLLVITPSIHWIHHHAIRSDTDSNYGTIFSFWDRLFRSKSPTERSKTLEIGVEKRSDVSFFALLKKPFIR